MVDDTAHILPTLYEYYTSNGVNSGLSDSQPDFTLNGQKIKIFSGALHYFRVHPKYWRDRLKKYRAAGLNCVETYVPWNVHEPEDGRFDFGRDVDQNDFSLFLDLVEFLQVAQQEDLLVILRPGPYICAEWEFGGLPSWLLRHKDLKVRTSDTKYVFYVERYFKQLLSLVEPLQFTKGGSIIAVQIENEYGNVKEEGKPIDTAYLEALKRILRDNGIVELLFTSDTPAAGFQGTLPDVLATANFQEECSIELALLKAHQPKKPLMVMEYWTGWFDHYTENHHERPVKKFEGVLEDILMWNSSFNLYMMHGGTNWGFLNGGNIYGTGSDNSGYQPDTSSYDYDAPLSENGDYTDKFVAVQKLTAEYNEIYVRQPSPPDPRFRVAYSELDVIGELSLDDLVAQSRHVIESERLVSMEMLNINEGSGQSYGYIVYRREKVDIKAGSVLKIEGHVCDTVLVLINGVLVSKVLENEGDLDGFGYWRLKDSTLDLGDRDYSGATLDLVVENFGRVNYGKLYQFNQYKGLWQGNVLINDQVVSDWKIIPLEFKKKWVQSLTGWKPPTFDNGPRLYKAILNIDSEPEDTYIDFKGWSKGFVVVNGFVLSRFFKLGPQQAGYLPAPFLNRGEHRQLYKSTLPDVLATANFQEECSIELALLKAHQPKKPLMVMEYWTGWFDHYTENHHERPVKKFEGVLEDILMWNSSFNLYMMHGGTNWGFLNGGNIYGTGSDNSGYQPDTSSYDYDAPLSENGDYTDKFVAVQKLTAEYNEIYVRQPSPPDPRFRVAYSELDVIGELSLDDLVAQSRHVIESERLVSMEMLNINEGSGQSYGYIVYRREKVDIKAGSVLKIEGHVCDTVLVLINGVLVSKVLENEGDLDGFGYWRLKDSTLDLGDRDYSGATLDLVVENFGRVNYGKLYQFNQYKGLWQGNVLINDQVVSDWKIIPLEFKKKWVQSLTGWKPPTFDNGPRLYKAILNIDSEPEDTYIDFKGWSKGFVVVNGFVLSRFFKLGPQQAGYLPAPFLNRGDNEILVFEHFVANKTVDFCTDPYFDTIGDGKILRSLLEQ